MIALRTCLLLALATTAFAGFVGSYVGAPVYGAHVVGGVSRSHRVDYHYKNPLVTGLAGYTTPFVGAVHTAPVFGLGHRYGLGYGYGLSPYGLNYGHGLGYGSYFK